MTSTLKADVIESKTTNGDLTISGDGTGVPDIEAGFKVGGTAGVPTSDLRASGTATHVLTSNGAGAAPTFQAAGGGAWAVKTSGSASAAAAIDITGLTKYTMIYLTNVRTGAGSDVQFRTSSDGGSSFDAGASDYNWYRHQNGHEGDTNDQAQISTVGEAYTDTAEDHCTIVVSISRPAGTSQTHLEWKMLHNNNTSIYYRFGFGIRKSQADVDAVRIMGNSGNITASYVVVELN